MGGRAWTEISGSPLNDVAVVVLKAHGVEDVVLTGWDFAVSDRRWWEVPYPHVAPKGSWILPLDMYTPAGFIFESFLTSRFSLHLPCPQSPRSLSSCGRMIIRAPDLGAGCPDSWDNHFLDFLCSIRSGHASLGNTVSFCLIWGFKD